MPLTTLESLSKKEASVADTAIKAMERGRRLSVEYDGMDRVVEVHAVGVSLAGRPCMRVYQVEGGSVSGEVYGWKLMTLSKIFNKPKILREKSDAPREGYRRNDAGMRYVFQEL